MFMLMVKIGELNSMYDHDSIHCTNNKIVYLMYRS